MPSSPWCQKTDEDKEQKEVGGKYYKNALRKPWRVLNMFMIPTVECFHEYILSQDLTHYTLQICEVYCVSMTFQFFKKEFRGKK